MASFRPSSAVNLPGFYFPPGPVFSHDQEIGIRIYAGLLGEDTSNLTIVAAKIRAVDSFRALFKCVLDYKDFYLNVQGAQIFWDVIANQAALHYDLTADDVKLITKTMAKARANYRGNDTTLLTQLVDSIIELDQQATTMPPPQAFSLAARPSASGAAATEAGQVASALTSNMVGMNIAPRWPPEHFTGTDLVFLADSKVIEHLSETDANDIRPRKTTPRTNSRSMPISLRLRLCYIALTRQTAQKNWVLFLTPVGFFHDADRRRWFTVAGQQTKVFATIPRFLSYAGEALRDRGKSIAMGMFCHWVPQSVHLPRVTDLVRDDPTKIWTDRDMMRRYATVVILRRVPTQTGMRVRLVCYDPWFKDATVKKQFAHSQHAVTNYRADVRRTIEQWAAENGIQIESQFYGGRVSSYDAVAGDSVCQCFYFIDTLVSGTWPDLPEADVEEALLKMGFSKSV